MPHHRKHELVSERKAFGTIESTGHYLQRHIEANFGSKRLLETRIAYYVDRLRGRILEPR